MEVCVTISKKPVNPKQDSKAFIFKSKLHPKIYSVFLLNGLTFCTAPADAPDFCGWCKVPKTRFSFKVFRGERKRESRFIALALCLSQFCIISLHFLFSFLLAFHFILSPSGCA